LKRRWVSGGNRSVAQRRAVIRGALEDGELAAFLGDFGDELDAGRAGADDGDALAGEVHLFLGPFAGVIGSALEAIDALERGSEMRRQDADGADQELGTGTLAVVDDDFPLIGLLVVDCRGDAGIELNVTAQIKFVGDVIQVALVFRLSRIVLLPVPFLEEFLGERVAVGFALGVEAAAGVAVPVPGAADAAAVLEEADRNSELAEPVELIQAGNAGADDNGVILFDRPRTCGGGGGLWRSCHFYLVSESAFT
jgi:hypothetical protein